MLDYSDKHSVSTPRAPFWLARTIPHEGVVLVSEATGLPYAASDLGIIYVPQEAPTWPSPLT